LASRTLGLADAAPGSPNTAKSGVKLKPSNNTLQKNLLSLAVSIILSRGLLMYRVDSFYLMRFFGALPSAVCRSFGY
jgi:hypothetical protein